MIVLFNVMFMVPVPAPARLCDNALLPVVHVIALRLQGVAFPTGIGLGWFWVSLVFPACFTNNKPEPTISPISYCLGYLIVTPAGSKVSQYLIIHGPLRV